QQRARNRRALLLSAGECHPTLADNRLEAARKLLNLARDMSCYRCVEHLLITRGIDSKRNVAANRLGEQEGLLRHKSDRPPQRLQRILANQTAVNQHLSRRRILQPRN